jgi:hypothetical protein
MAPFAAAAIVVAVGGSDAHGGCEMFQGRSLRYKQIIGNEARVYKCLNGGLL